MADLWSEFYRPKSMDGYVFKSDDLKKKVQSWISQGSLPHVTFCGPAGTGKTTLAFLVLEELGVDECDILYISASVNNGVDYIRNQVVNFAETIPFGEYKYIILDEADYISNSGQAALRGIMQDYSETTRFILTCNFVGKIMDAVLSRCPPIVIDTLNVNEYTHRAAEILIEAGVSIEESDLETINGYVDKFYPDLRKCVNAMQLSCVDGNLMPYDDAVLGTETEIFQEMVSLYKDGKIKEARELVCSNLSPDQYINAYRFLYKNVSLFSRDEKHECECIKVIKDGLVEHASAGDPEICLSATISTLFIL